jgi:two-component system, OmpR family, response regulator
MAQGKKKKIFVVEDEEMMAEALRDFITSKTQNEVEIFGTGEECLKKLDENPDVIILDYFLDTVVKGAANGMQILEAIKKRKKDVHVIMLSSQEQYGVAMKTIINGAEQYVIKDNNAFDKILSIISEY